MSPLAHALLVLLLAFAIAGVIVSFGVDQIGVQVPISHIPPS
jgi:hypothetical protein